MKEILDCSNVNLSDHGEDLTCWGLVDTLAVSVVVLVAPSVGGAVLPNEYAETVLLSFGEVAGIGALLGCDASFSLKLVV